MPDQCQHRSTACHARGRLLFPGAWQLGSPYAPPDSIFLTIMAPTVRGRVGHTWPGAVMAASKRLETLDRAKPQQMSLICCVDLSKQVLRRHALTTLKKRTFRWHQGCLCCKLGTSTTRVRSILHLSWVGRNLKCRSAGPGQSDTRC